MLTPPPGPGSFADRLAEAVARAGSPACVGLDPVLERLPEEVRGAYADPGQALVAFSRGVIDAVAGIVPAVKFQSACYERHDLARELRGLVLEARAAGLLVVLDAKRGDIGISAEHYAHAAFSGPGGADALTVSGYLGPDALAPFLVDGHGLFVLVRTSNPGSDQVQSLRLEGGRSVAEMMAGHVRRLGAERVGSAGLSDVGAVVGATKAADAAALRELMPEQVFLVPGYGAQGGTLRDIAPMLRPGRRTLADAGVLVTASRSVIYPEGAVSGGARWTDRVRTAADAFAHELRALA